MQCKLASFTADHPDCTALPSPNCLSQRTVDNVRCVQVLRNLLLQRNDSSALVAFVGSEGGKFSIYISLVDHYDRLPLFRKPFRRPAHWMVL
jgi:hypothetical protein